MNEFHFQECETALQKENNNSPIKIPVYQMDVDKN